MRRALICTVAVMALAGCGKKETAPPVAGTQASATASAQTAAAPAPLTAPPQRRAGLWEQTISSDRMKQSVSMCLDDAFSKKMTLWGQQTGKDPCEKSVVTPRLGGGWTFSSVCDLGPGGRIVSQGVASGDFGSHYTVDVSSTTTGASMPQANGDHKMHMEATWKGACPAAMRAGDMQLSNGMTINMADAMDAGGKPGAGPHRPSADQMAAMRKIMESQKH